MRIYFVWLNHIWWCISVLIIIQGHEFIFLEENPHFLSAIYGQRISIFLITPKCRGVSSHKIYMVRTIANPLLFLKYCCTSVTLLWYLILVLQRDFANERILVLIEQKIDRISTRLLQYIDNYTPRNLKPMFFLHLSGKNHRCHSNLSIKQQLLFVCETS